LAVGGKDFEFLGRQLCSCLTSRSSGRELQSLSCSRASRPPLILSVRLPEMTLMKKLSLHFVLALIAFLGCNQALSESLGQQGLPSKNTTRAEASEQTKADSLRAELKAIREYHNSLLDTVYWALGTIVGLALLLIGSSWYTNFRLYESDKARLQEEVDKKIAEAQNLISRDLQSLADNLNGKVDRDTLAISSRFTTEIGNLQNVMKDADLQVSTSLKGLEDAFAVIHEMPNKIIRRLNRIDLQTQLNTERIWEIKESPLKVLLSQYIALSLAIEMRSNDEITGVLERMKNNLINHMLPSGKTIPSNILQIVQSSLVQHKDLVFSNQEEVLIDPSLAAEIIDLLSNVPITEPFKTRI